VVAGAMWGAGILVSIAVVAGAAAITFAILKSNFFTPADGGATVHSIESQGVKKNAAEAPAPTPAPSPAPTPTAKTTATTSIGTAPVLGNVKTAKVAIVEWSDLECPFCQKFHDETFDKIVTDYVNTGKAVFVFRNYPLDFHGDASLKEANAALCVREAAGDKAYFAFVKDVYANTGLNGKGMSDETLAGLVTKDGGSSLSSCLENRKFKSVVEADLSAGNDAGVSATPSFIIGKIGQGGAVEGQIVAGAMPYPEFKKAIDAALGS